MNQHPPVPETSPSPFPLSEPPRHFIDEQSNADAQGDGNGFSLGGLLDEIGIDTRTAIGIGAAIGVGAIAGISALLFSSRSKASSNAKSPTKSARKPAQARKARTSKSGAKSGSTKALDAKGSQQATP